MPDTQTEKHSKYFADQFDDEEVLFVFRKHPIVMRKGLIFGLLGPLIGVIPSITPLVNRNDAMKTFFIGLVIGFVAGVIVFFPSWIGWHFSVFIVTDQRFLQIKQKGLFNRSVSDLGLRQIQAVSYEISGIQETLLGFGTIIMRTYVGEIVIHDVHHPAKIQKKFVGVLRDLGITTADYPGSAMSQSEMNEQVE
ncbi:MAG: PH domain-containing protein [Candidatus Saccharimonadales bacterium]